MEGIVGQRTRVGHLSQAMGLLHAVTAEGKLEKGKGVIGRWGLKGVSRGKLGICDGYN